MGLASARKALSDSTRFRMESRERFGVMHLLLLFAAGVDGVDCTELESTETPESARIPLSRAATPASEDPTTLTGAGAIFTPVDRDMPDPANRHNLSKCALTFPERHVPITRPASVSMSYVARSHIKTKTAVQTSTTRYVHFQ